MKALSLFLISSFFALRCFAQDSSGTREEKIFYYVQTVDGIRLTGRFTGEDEQWIFLTTPSLGEVSVLKSRIKILRRLPASRFRNGEYWLEDPAASHYILSPSAIGLHSGEACYSNLYLFMQSFNVGLSEHFSLGAGTELASPVFDWSLPQLFYFDAQRNFEVAPGLRMSAGLLCLGSGLGFGTGSEGGRFGILYSLATLGNADNNVTLGFGWDYHSFDHYDPFTYGTAMDKDKGVSKKPVIAFSAKGRVGKHVALVTENWIFPARNQEVNYYYHTVKVSYDYYFIFSYGVRFFTEHFSIDAGLLNNSDIIKEIPVGLPYIGMNLKFGGRKNANDRDWILQGKR